MKIYKCDKCGTTEPEPDQANRPKGWRYLSFSIGTKYVYKDICPDCSVALKLPEQIQCKEVGDRLIEIIEDIVHGVIENQ
ncbi:MAG: hypothetical protein MUP81_04305 [Dehalococcoidia bacterium]|nr:hypothetical protein [Dehalococcoidia bacterium]